MRKKWTHTYYINLPKGSVSPTGSIYKRFDIVKQGKALWDSNVGSKVISPEPFLLRVQVGKRIIEIESKVEK